MRTINWWNTNFGVNEAEAAYNSVINGKVSQGTIVAEFENELGKYLNTKNVVCCTNGTSAIYIALMAKGIGYGDEVIIPDKTWIATAHAVIMTGAKPVIIDICDKNLVLDYTKIHEFITANTKAIICVNFNGRYSYSNELLNALKNKDITIIEDAAQSLACKSNNRYLGTISHIGCFSLSVAKLISSGQGGFIVTDSDEIAEKCRLFRTHGIENIHDPKIWPSFGFNFRFTDIQASIGLIQLKNILDKIEAVKKVYLFYKENLNTEFGELLEISDFPNSFPIYIEILPKHNSSLTRLLNDNQIDYRPFYPRISKANYIKSGNVNIFQNSKYIENAIYLPSGPTLNLDELYKRGKNFGLFK
jgi:dTDP-4-amino-4,6-dideoxygalactose transaminase